ncbi:5742_t:CDS:2, partial [Entrophospora sp. SA101]
MFVRRRNKFQETYKSAAAGNVTMVHNHCVEQENGIARVPHAINKNKGSENTPVGVIACLINVAIYQLLINSKVEVTRNECQSVA